MSLSLHRRQSHLPACVSRTYRRARDGGDVSTLTRAPAVAASSIGGQGSLIAPRARLTTPASLRRNPHYVIQQTQDGSAARRGRREGSGREACERETGARGCRRARSRPGMNQAKRMRMLFSPTIGCVLKARHWFLGVRSRACRTTQAVDLRTLDRHPWSAISSLIPSEVVPRLLATRSIRRACPPVRQKHRRRTARAIHPPGVGRLSDRCGTAAPEPPSGWRSQLGVTTSRLGVTTLRLAYKSAISGHPTVRAYDWSK